MSPDTSQEVGLQFQTHAHAIGFGFVTASSQFLLELLNLHRQSKFILHMVTNFMRNDIGHSEITRGSELVTHLLKEAHVEIDVLIARTIERTDRGAGATAGRVNLIAKEHELGGMILLAHARHDFRPGVFGIGQHLAAEPL